MVATFGVPLPLDPPPLVVRARGLDLSEAQGAHVDFVKIREVGKYDFVVLKATEGNTYVDPDFLASLKRAKAAGLLATAYLFLGKLSKVADQIKLFSSVAKGGLDLKPWLDWEAPAPSKWDAKVNGDYLIKRTLEAGNLIEQDFGARQVVVYSYPDFMIHLPQTPELLEVCSYDLAFAHYADQKREPRDADAFPIPPRPWLAATFLQWSGDGGMPAPGCPSVVDHDLYFGTVDELRGTPASELEDADTSPGPLRGDF